MRPTINRRRFLLSLPALALAPRILDAQPGGAPIRVRGINHVSLNVADLARSVDFYQRLFGLPSRRLGATSVQLQIGSGPQHLGLSAAAPGAAPKIDHFCLGVDAFNVDRITKVLAEHGVAKSEKPGPLTLRVIAGAAGAPSLHMGDPDGIDVQLQDAAYCGGSGPLGTVCTPVAPSPSTGLIALKGYSHMTVFSTDAEKTNAFYKDVFGMGIRSYQGPTAPTRAVGGGVEFLMFTGGAGGRAGAPPRPASINHFCMTLENFKPDEILKTLERVGIKPRESQTGPVGPLRHYISMRVENRGGAKEGTPELYFTDPDGLLVQLQDVKYCGGSGYLGDVCPPAPAP
jgi:catechol 2,3-dioxygenase-like lactoylglutathione lyase family enzyme